MKTISERTLKIVLLISTITSLLITIFTKTHISDYNRLFVFPIITLILGYTCLANLIGTKINKKAYYYLIYIALILISNFIITIAPVNKVLNYIVLPLLIAIYIITLINPNFKMSINIYKWFLKLFPAGLFSNLDYVEKSVKATKLNNNKIKEIAKALLITIPLAAIVLILLTKADKYFYNVVKEMLSVFKFNYNFSSIISTLITIVLSFILVFSTSINIDEIKDFKEEKNNKIHVSNTISYILLIVLNLVYLLFVISEISKLTINFLNIPIEYTYASYAREGFFELLGVSTINFAIILFYLNFANNKENNTNIKRLLLLIIIFSIFIIFNSYYRMGLYIFEYGFTILRTQVILFLTMELLFFISLIIKLFKEAKKNNRFKYMMVMFITYALNIYLCNQTVITFINKLIDKN